VLWAAKQQPFAIVNAHLLDREDGYPIPDESRYFPGEQVYASFNIAGYRYDEEYQIKLDYRIDFVGAGAAPFSMSQTGRFEEEIFPQDEKWLPVVRAAARIPFHAEAGAYTIRLTASDELAGQQVTAEVRFVVQGQSLPAGQALTIRNFMFLTGDEGERLPVAAYRPGDTVWGSFFITGFQVGQDNSYDIDSDLRIVSEDGEVMYTFAPEGEHGSPFYPRRWVPAKFHIALDKDIPQGRYAIELSVRDKLGDKTYQAKQYFQVR